MKRADLSVIVKNICMRFKVSCYNPKKYDGTDEWIMKRLFEYADICKDINNERGLKVNAMHAYMLIHELCDSDDREKVRYFYNFYKTARRMAMSGFSLG